MLEQVLAGTPVTLGLAGWAAYGPALAVGILALLLLALPSLRSRPTTARRPDQVVMRSTDDVGIRAYLPGLILGAMAAALAYYGSKPQVVVTLESLTCRPWTRPLLLSEIRAVTYREVGTPARPAVHLDVAYASEMRRGGVTTRIEEVAVSVLRGPAELTQREGTCSLGGLSGDGRLVARAIQTAWARATFGELPDLTNDAAVMAHCAAVPVWARSNCAASLRSVAQQCPRLTGSELAGCRYMVLGDPALMGAPPGRPAGQPVRPPTPQTQTPQAPSPQAPAPPRPPTPPTSTPPATPPSPPAAPGTPPATPTPSGPPATTPPAAPPTPPATPPPPAGPGKPTAPGGTAGK